jgi:uncharacterized OsmC-like protein/dienelactone hydrolase
MRSERVDLDGQGQRLSGRLELPHETPRGFALLVHRMADEGASTFARQLAKGGIAVLHLPAPEGSDEATAAVVAAAEHLREHHRSPAALVGHSRGGAAVLAAAEQVREVRAVVTVGASADPDRHPPAGSALLVLHSPVDEAVPIDDARKIFDDARHPKSFVALDDADHQLSREADVRFAATVTAAWLDRYLDEPARVHSPEGPVAGEVTVVENAAKPYGQQVLAGRHELVVDEPRPVGRDTGPSPYDLVLAGLGACTSMTVRMYADRKKWPLEKVSVTLRHSRIHADDCDRCETENGKLDHIERMVRLDGELDDEQRARLLDIADKCPVHRTLHSEVVVDTSLDQEG